MYMMYPVLWLIPAIIFVIALLLLWYFTQQIRSVYYGSPFISSSTADVDAMIQLAHIHPGMHIYDLGSGDGRLLFAAAKQGASATGIEINSYCVLLTRIKARLKKESRVTVIHGSLFDQNLSRADVVFVYLLPDILQDLQIKLKNELKPDAVIISKSFEFPNWRPQAHTGDFYLYHIGSQAMTSSATIVTKGNGAKKRSIRKNGRGPSRRAGKNS